MWGVFDSLFHLSHSQPSCIPFFHFSFFNAFLLRRGVPVVIRISQKDGIWICFWVLLFFFSSVLEEKGGMTSGHETWNKACVSLGLVFPLAEIQTFNFNEDLV